MTGYKHIVVADDDEDDIEMLVRALNECSLELNVTAVSNGRDLIALLKREPAPDLIVLDLNMPYMNGYDCLAAIRANPDYGNIPIMILSTSSSEDDVENCLRKGACYYAVKPSTVNGLRNLVEQMCNKIMTAKITTPN
jgi:CheY-like chemotaxis protein